MPDFEILTDSSADLSDTMARQLDVHVLPLGFTLDGHTYYNYPDNREMDPHLFFEHLRKGEVATTSAANVAQYTEALEPLLQAGRDVLILTLSSGMSTTYNFSLIAVEDLRAKYPERKLYAVDSLCASMGHGLLVWYAARERERGRSIEEVRDWVEAHKLNICHQVTVDDLYFLKRGGRISGATAVVGSMLQIKPIIYVDNEGRLVNIGKARGRNASLRTLVDRMEQNVMKTDSLTVFICHGDCMEDAQLVSDMVKERFEAADIHLNYVGPVIGAHTGPGLMALFYMGTER